MTIDRRKFLAGAALLAAGRAMGAGAAAGTARRPIPFRAGRSDLDSGIACARMALTFFEPLEHFPVADLAEMTAYTDGHWFFEPQLAPIMIEKARAVEIFSDLDYPAIAAGKGLDRFGPDAEKMIDRQALKWALDTGAAGVTKPALDLPALLERFKAGGFLTIVADRGVLRGSTLPYCRYFIVVTGFDGKTVRFHDPSLGPDRELPVSQVAQAFGLTACGRSALMAR